MSTDTTAATGTDIAPTTEPRTLTNPATGEVINLDTDATDIVARFALDVQDVIDQLAEIRDAARVELTVRMDRAATWTFRHDDLEAKALSPTAGGETFDAKPLRQDLMALAEEGVLDILAVDKAVEMDITPRYKARKAGIDALRKLPDPRVAEVIERHRQVAPPASAKSRKATVKRLVRS